MALFVSVCALQDASFTGLVVHEWLGIAMVGMTLAHLVLAWSWIATQSRRLFVRQPVRSRINYVLNFTLFAGITAVIFSGILISQKAVPVLTGTQPSTDLDWHWDTLHHRFSQDVLFLVGLHLAINWDWVLAAVQRMLLPWAERIQEGLRSYREGAP